MKKQLFFLAASLLSAAYTLNAGPVDANKAVDIAQNFFAQKAESSPGLRGSATLTIEYIGGKSSALRGATNQNLYYVINRGNGQGFVIVSGDDRVPAVLGYSEEGRLSTEDIAKHPSFAGFFADWDRQMEYAIAHTPDKPYAAPAATLRADTLPSAVKPLLMSHRDGHIAWGQNHPFNYYSPKVVYKSKTYPTVSGCVATGMSTVMRWHRWPQKPVGKTSYRWICQKNSYVLADSTISRDYAKDSKPYKWNLMNPRPNQSIPDSNAKEIGRLLFDVGVAVKMQFGPGFMGGSGTYIEHCAPALINHFNYKNSAKFLLRSDYTKEEWMKLVKTELRHSPIIYGGISNDGGHCFVIDGYNADDYVHVDWGWNTMSNGYFLIDILDPGEQGTGGGSGGFKYRQQMIHNLYPNKTGNEEPDEPTPDDPDQPTPTQEIELSVSGATTASVKGSNTNSAVTIRINKIKNSGKSPFTGKIGLAISDADGNMTLLKSINVNNLATYDSVPKIYSATIRSIYFSSYSAGNYVIVPIYSVVENGQDNWFYFETGSVNANLGATIKYGYISFYALSSSMMMNGPVNFGSQPMTSAETSFTEPALYPTTASAEVSLIAPKGFERATIFNTAGMLVGDYRLTEGTNTIDVSDLPAGTYVVKMNASVLRFIKK